MKYCANCGSELRDDARFCMKCGKPQQVQPQGQQAGAVKRGFIHTTAEKIVAAGVGICIIAGTAACQQDDGLFVGGEDSSYVSTEADSKLTGLVTETAEDAAVTTVETEEVLAEAVGTELELTDELCGELLAGGITRADFEFILAYGPESMLGGEVSIDDLESLLLRIAMDGEYYNISIAAGTEDNTAMRLFNLSEVNNYISLLTDYQFSEADNNSLYNHTDVSGDTLYEAVGEPASSNYVTIQSAVLSGDTMTVEYDFEEVRISDDTGEEIHNTSQKIAILHRLDNGSYRITSISDAAMLKGRMEAYILTLENLYSRCIWPDGSTVDVIGEMSEDMFAVYDVDGDGEEELVIRYTSSSSAGMQEAVYGYDEETGELILKLTEYPALTYYDNGFIRADASHNQSDDEEAWPYTMYQYSQDTGIYEEVGSGVANDGSIEGYVEDGNEVELPYISITEENIQSIQ